MITARMGLARLAALLAIALTLLAGTAGVPTGAGAATPAGPVYGWGDNQAGELAGGPLTTRPVPGPAGGIEDAISIATGAGFSLAVRADGSVLAWGDNRYGQLGDGTTTQRTMPVPVAGLGGVTAVAAGFGFSLALLADGTVRAWGDNRHGQLGDGTTTDRRTPVPVAGLGGVKAIAAGYESNLALLADGTVRAWGENGHGEIGTGTVGGTRVTPTRVAGLAGVRTIAAGHGFGLALLDDGTVRTWGVNFACFGCGSDHPTPVPVADLGGVTAIAAGPVSNHALAIMADGTVRAWGANEYGELGRGTSCDTVPRECSRDTPTPVAGLADVRAVAAGYGSSVVVLADGTARAWGSNRYAQLGDGTYMDRLTPVVVRDVRGVLEVAPGFSHTLARLGGPIGPPSPVPSPSPSTPPGPDPSFVDVPAGYWAHDQIIAFARRGITTGCDTDAQGLRYYCPERGVTRAEMAAFITRALGQDKPPPPATPTFADVPADYWAYGQIEAFLSLGITTGCGEDDQGRRLFCPERGVTRAEMAAFMVRAKGQTGLTPGTPTFADVPGDYWAYGWIERFFTLGITTGCGEDERGRTYCPERVVTRAEMAVFIIRAYPLRAMGGG